MQQVFVMPEKNVLSNTPWIEYGGEKDTAIPLVCNLYISSKMYFLSVFIPCSCSSFSFTAYAEKRRHENAYGKHKT